MFNKVRIPRQNLLDQTGNVTSEGTYNTSFKVPVSCGYLRTELGMCLFLWWLRPPQEHLALELPHSFLGWVWCPQQRRDLATVLVGKGGLDLAAFSGYA